MRNTTRKPLIGIPVNITRHPEHGTLQHAVGTTYVDAVVRGGDGMPMLVPALGEALDYDDVAGRLDGLVLTGGRANVEPHHYGGPPFPDDEHIDPLRDATVLPLIRACIDHGVPVFGICRGVQEMNVALGGTLHYRIHLLPGKMDHRMLRDGTREERYAHRHLVHLTPGGMLAGLAGGEEAMVNTLHGQGIDRLAEGLVVEARAVDGVIEAVRLEGAKTFTVGVQWHAEWFETNPLSAALFAAFGEAARARLEARAGAA